MIEANEKLFTSLEMHCERRGDPVVSPGAGRWVQGDSTASDWLAGLVVLDKLEFGFHRSLIHMQLDGTHFIGLVGFEFRIELTNVIPVPINPGALVVMLSQTRVEPTASPARIRNVVEAAHKGEHGYDGHDAALVEDLYPALTLLQLDDPIDSDTAWRAFFQLCANECGQGGSWVSAALAAELGGLANMNVPSLPYEQLCRSMFDLDPRSMYMALYRCVEATYAFESCRKLVASLGLSLTWQELATALERELSWHPREASSLNLVLKYAEQRDLAQVCTCLSRDVSDDPIVSAGRAIYDLRNRIVHYRLGHDTVDVDGIDWNLLCTLLIAIVFNVFTTAFKPDAV